MRPVQNSSRESQHEIPLVNSAATLTITSPSALKWEPLRNHCSFHLEATRAKSFSHVWLFVTLWTIVHHAPLSKRLLQARILEWVAIFSSRGSSRPMGRIHIAHVSYTGRQILFTTRAIWEAHPTLIPDLPNVDQETWAEHYSKCQGQFPTHGAHLWLNLHLPLCS